LTIGAKYPLMLKFNIKDSNEWLEIIPEALGAAVEIVVTKVEMMAEGVAQVVVVIALKCQKLMKLSVKGRNNYAS
jgi:hypothetical protein